MKTMPDRSDVCVLIPTYNEAAAIGEVIDGFQEQGFENILVMDGKSTDRTREIARDRGVRVREQSGQGKGQAVREALTFIDAPVVLMIDGDATYRPEEAERLLDPILNGDAEHVIGNRFANMQSGAMTRLNRFGNRMINGAFKTVHRRDFKDILSGYRAFTRDSVRRFSLTADGFGIETEMSVECVKHDVPTRVVPITYEPRPEDADTNLSPVRDGAVILMTLYQMAKTNNPLFYFGSVGVLSAIVGVLAGLYVAVEWFTRGISHEVIAVVAALGIIFGVQLLMFGVLSDMIVTLHREQRHFIERLAGEGSEFSVHAGSGDARTESVETAGGDESPADTESEDTAATTDGDDSTEAVAPEEN